MEVRSAAEGVPAPAVYNHQQSRVKTVAIAIPSLHRPDLTARCIEFIQKQTLSADSWEIVVIENEARPGEVLPDPLPPNTRRIDLPTNEGTTGSINRAVSATESQYILLLNNDVELAPDYLQKLVDVMGADPKLGFATGKLLRATERTHLDGAGDAMLMAGAAYRLGHGDEDRGQFDQPMRVLAGCGAAVLYRRSAFMAAGGLDPEFFAYLDDLDLALRTRLMGFGGLYVPDAIAYHVGSATLGEPMHPRIVEYITRNQLYLLIKNYPRPVLVRLLPRIVVYQFLWMMLATNPRGSGPVVFPVPPFGRVSAYFHGVMAAFRNRSSMRRKGDALLARQRIGDNEFVARLRDSERQIYDWHQSRPPRERSALLKLYFFLFGKP